MILNKKARSLHHKTVKTPFPRKSKKFDFSKSQKTFFARDIVREIVGRAPYELCAMDMIKKSQDKKVKRYLRKRLGNLKCAKKKIDSLTAEIHQ